jgi:hypothetical protein
MASPTTRYWLTLVTGVEALFAFFAGVYFSAWGDELTSPVWVWIMSVPGGGRTWGSLFLVFGIMFLFGLDWHRVWPRIVGCAGTGLMYLAVGVVLLVAPLPPFRVSDSLSGSTGMWFLGGLLTLCLAGFMRAEYRQELLEQKRKANHVKT